MALLRDDKVTVRRGGLTTARYREVMMTPIGPGLTEEQDFWLCQVLGQAGATRMEKFPRLVNRLGAPANGLTDYPVPPPLDGAAPFSRFVTALLGRGLRKMVEADLALQADRPDAAAELARSAGFTHARISHRFNCFRGTSAERKVSRDLFLHSLNFFARKGAVC